MNALDRRPVLITAGRLDDLLELARMASERLPETDPLARELRASTAAVRSEALMEP